MNLLYNLQETPQNYSHERDRLLRIPVAGTGLTGKGFYSLCRVLQYPPLCVLVTNCWYPPALPCSIWHTHHCAQEASVQWAGAHISGIFKYSEILFLARVSLRRPRTLLKCSSGIASLLESTSSAKCGPTALSNTQPQAWGPPKFRHKSEMCRTPELQSKTAQHVKP